MQFNTASHYTDSWISFHGLTFVGSTGFYLCVVMVTVEGFNTFGEKADAWESFCFSAELLFKVAFSLNAHI